MMPIVQASYDKQLIIINPLADKTYVREASDKRVTRLFYGIPSNPFSNAC